MTGTTKDLKKIPVDVSVHVEQNLCISRWCCITDKVILLNYFDINLFFKTYRTRTSPSIQVKFKLYQLSKYQCKICKTTMRD